MTRLDETVDRVVATPASHLPDVELGRRIVGVQTQMRRLQAVLAADMREAELRDAGVADGSGSAVAWLRARTHTSKHDADATRTLGRDCERLPVMAAALAAGGVSVAHVQVLAAATRRLDRDRVAADRRRQPPVRQHRRTRRGARDLRRRHPAHHRRP